MKNELMKTIVASEFKGIAGIEYFNFEEDFVEKNIRCIPMIVRFKMDKAGIKLKLSEWVKFKVEERIELALLACSNVEEACLYNNYLASLIRKYTGNEPTTLEINKSPGWANLDKVPEPLQEQGKKLKRVITNSQWRSLTNLQRFALLKLLEQGHENKNFPRAMKEFGLMPQSFMHLRPFKGIH